MKKQTFYSNGKLLLSAEYLVLDGAEALALPTQLGQSLIIEANRSKTIVWESFDANGKLWYVDSFHINEIFRDTKKINPITQTLFGILKQAHDQNNLILGSGKGYHVQTRLTFPRKWGLGTSSTLINNIAQWFKIDAFELLQKSFGGSGYDIACAQTNQLIVYQLIDQKPIFNTVNFNPNFKENLFFVYLNQKQNSKEAIKNYRQLKVGQDSVRLFSDLTKQLLEASTIAQFQSVIDTHEKELSLILEVPTIKEKLFADFEGSIKSLGAWGGDFILAVSEKNDVKTYFQAKGYKTILSYSEMIR